MSKEPRELRTQLSREDGLERLANLASRLGVAASAVKVRRLAGSESGMTLTIALKGGALAKSCDSQPTKDQNLLCLVLWLGDLVKNIERGIETFVEAFYNEGARPVAA